MYIYISFIPLSAYIGGCKWCDDSALMKLDDNFMFVSLALQGSGRPVCSCGSCAAGCGSCGGCGGCGGWQLWWLWRRGCDSPWFFENLPKLIWRCLGSLGAEKLTISDLPLWVLSSILYLIFLLLQMRHRSKKRETVETRNRSERNRAFILW